MPISWIDMHSTRACLDDSAEWKTLRDELVRRQGAGELALLIGSGISQFAPSGVPTGMRIANSIRDMLLRELEVAVGAHIREELSELPFEVLMGRCAELDPVFARKVAVALTQLSRPNPCHMQIARLVWRAAMRGASCPVVTTNYDLGVELAAERLTWPAGMAPSEVTIHEDVHPGRANEIFHIHGSVRRPESIVMDYKEEFVLDPWKRSHLARLLQGKLLVIHGFSGHDLDICRELVRIPLSGVVWIRASRADDSWPADARELMLQGGGMRTAVAVDGRFERVFLTLGAAIRPRWKAGPINHRLRALSVKSSPSLVTAWAYWTGLRAGHGALAAALSRDVLTRLPKRIQWEILSFGDYYSARHRTGAKGQSRAARLAQGEHSLARELYHVNNQVEFLNRGGYALSACAVLGAAALRHSRHLAAIRSDPSAQREWKNLWASVHFLWPFFQLGMYLSERWGPDTSSRAEGRGAGTGTGDLDKDMALDAMRSGFRDTSRLEERYRWLGQPARLINLNRVIAMRALRGSYGRGPTGLDEARRRVRMSIAWARTINDPCRLSRGRLVRLECHLAVREAWLRQGVSARHLRYSAAAWKALTRAELEWLYVSLPWLIYSVGSWLGGRQTRWLRRVGHELRLLGLYGLEVP